MTTPWYKGDILITTEWKQSKQIIQCISFAINRLLNGINAKSKLVRLLAILLVCIWNCYSINQLLCCSALAIIYLYPWPSPALGIVFTACPIPNYEVILSILLPSVCLSLASLHLIMCLNKFDGALGCWLLIVFLWLLCISPFALLLGQCMVPWFHDTMRW